MGADIRAEWPNYGGALDPTVWMRIRASMNHEEGDRVPIWDYLDNRPTFEYFHRPGDTHDETMRRAYHELGIDLCRGYGSSFSREDEGRAGDHEEWKISGLTQWATKKPISNYAELKSFQPRLFTEEDCSRWLKHTQEAQARMAPLSYFVPGVGTGFHEVYDLMGQQLFSYAIYDERRELDRLFEAYGYNSTLIARYAASTKPGPLFFTWADIAYKGRLLFSRSFLRETFIPMLRSVCQPLAEAGIKVVFHSDGDVTEILDDMLDAGITGLNPVEPQAGMDIGRLKKRYGKRLILVGNIDCSQVLPLGSVQDVVEAVKTCLREAGHGGGLFVGSSSEIVPSTPLENVLAFFEACRTFGRYPLAV
ncbi:MAG TPA: uroporphyrinogen decarboxylase family protein [Candidatus Latescibacteria bacterium]|nr:uroporphyrinogen decarboxylase family protein [Candidatus Latescibacterota bacterium]